MTKDEFNQGMLLLEGGFQKKFSEATFKVWWSESMAESGIDFIRVCRAMIGDEASKCSFAEVRARLHGLSELESTGPVVVGHNPSRPYGSHGWPLYYRQILRQLRNFSEAAKCCEACRLEIEHMSRTPAKAAAK